MSAPVPRHLTDEERALWEKATVAGLAADEAAVYSTLTTGFDGRRYNTLVYAAREASKQFITAANPSVILSLLTALATEREAGERLAFATEQLRTIAGYGLDVAPGMDAETSYRLSAGDCIRRATYALNVLTSGAVLTSTEPTHE